MGRKFTMNDSPSCPPSSTPGSQSVPIPPSHPARIGVSLVPFQRILAVLLRYSSSWASLRVLVATILLLGAAFKAHALLDGGDRSYASLPVPRWLLYEQLVLESVLAIWLLSGRFARQARIASLACFALFICISLRSALSGEQVCGCFGYLAVSPWLTSLMDFAVLLALLLVRPPSRSPSAGRQPSWPFARTLAKSLSTLLVLVTASFLFFNGALAHYARERYDDGMRVGTPSGISALTT